MSRRILIALLALALTASAAGCTPKSATLPVQESQAGSSAISGEKSDDELVVAVSGMVTPAEGLPYYEGMSRYVAAKAGKQLRLIHKASYAELNKLLEVGSVDMAFSCSGPYVIGHDTYGLKLLAAPVVNGTSTYNAYIIVPASSEATSLESLRGKTFAFTDPDSNTGCLVPTYMLAKMNASPDTYFKRIYYTYGHDNSIKQVAEGKTDGASVDSLIWNYMDGDQSNITSKTRIVAKSPDYGIPPVVVRPGLDPKLESALRDAFINAHKDPEGRKLLAAMHMERFAPIDDSAYQTVREMNAWVDKYKRLRGK